MYRLTIVSGPNRGASYSVKDGETAIGRQTSNQVVLSSSKVSKRHCVLIVDNGGVKVRDEGSANGTMVNGTLTKYRSLNPGDRITVGEFILEISQSGANALQPVVIQTSAVPPPVPMNPLSPDSMGQIIPFPNSSSQMPSMHMPSGHGAPPAHGGSLSQPGDEIPTDFKEKLLWLFEKKVMPIFYGMNFKNEWRVIGFSLLAVFLIANLLLTVSPVLDLGLGLAMKSAQSRAKFIAIQIAERNSAAMAARTETKTDIPISIERAEGVTVAVVTDLDLRILAPSSLYNQHLATGPEAVYAAKVRDAFIVGREEGTGTIQGRQRVIWVEPVKVYSAKHGINVVAGMAVVGIDTTSMTPGPGDIGLVYSEALILTAAFGLLLLLIGYRLTLKPLQVLTEDIDMALKGDLNQVTHEFKWQELNPLWAVVNSALQRMPKRGESALGDSNSGDPIGIEDFAFVFRAFGDFAKVGLAVCDADKKVVYLNPVFEAITGIGQHSAHGSDITTQGTDPSVQYLFKSLFEKVGYRNEPMTEDTSIKGEDYKVIAAAYGATGLGVKGYLLVLSRRDA